MAKGKLIHKEKTFLIEGNEYHFDLAAEQWEDDKPRVYVNATYGEYLWSSPTSTVTNVNKILSSIIAAAESVGEELLCPSTFDYEGEVEVSTFSTAMSIVNILAEQLQTTDLIDEWEAACDEDRFIGKPEESKW